MKAWLGKLKIHGILASSHSYELTMLKVNWLMLPLCPPHIHASSDQSTSSSFYPHQTDTAPLRSVETMKNAPLTTPTCPPKWESESLLLLGELLSAAKKFACYVVHFSSPEEEKRERDSSACEMDRAGSIKKVRLSDRLTECHGKRWLSLLELSSSDLAVDLNYSNERELASS